MKIRDIGEIGLIERLAKRIRLDRSVIKGIGDDTAVIRWTRKRHLLFTCDILVEDIHFIRREATPFQIGWKALARNVSDIAAMGGIPRHALVSAAMPPNLPVSFADGVYRGLRAVAERFKINLVGGDMSSSDKIVIDVALLGEVETGNLVLRSCAKKGDLILVTGSIGGSIKGKHLNFTPRLREARALVRDFDISSMIDISDGLILDLRRLIDASRLGARIYQGAIPVSRDADSFEGAISDGEDFELLFTMSVKEARRFFKRSFARMETPVTLIGEIVDRRFGYHLIGKDGSEKTIKTKGYLHFK